MGQSQVDPAGFEARIEQYSEWQRIKAFSEWTIRTASGVLRRFSIWCEERGILRPSELTRPMVERYQRQLFHSINPRTDQPLSITTQSNTLGHIRSFFRWLAKQHLILYNPTADIDMPRRDTRQLPKGFLTVEEVEQVLATPNVNEPLGLRDRAMMETFYATGLRRMEICNLKINSVNLEDGLVFVRRGKGRKDRVVPISARACRWIRTYLEQGRPRIVCAPDESYLFLSSHGRQIGIEALTGVMRRNIIKSGVGKKGACHLFRHTCATLMLDGGADIRHVQVMLGHADISATQIYTHVALKKLKEIYENTHPGAKPDD